MIEHWDATPSATPDDLIAQNIRTILKTSDRAAELGSFALALFGEPPLAGQGHIPDKEILEKLGVYEPHGVKHEVPGFTLRNIQGFTEKMYAGEQTARWDAYKFYLSLDLTNDQNIAAGSELYETLAAGALERDTHFASKYWAEHAYDSLLLYTSGKADTIAVGEMLQDLYPAYQELFVDTPRYYQGSVPGINPEHVGWVQEQLGPRAVSFSQRLKRLGHSVDMLAQMGDIQDTLTSKTFQESCLAANMDPLRPYLLARRVD